ncbi:MAG: RloB family protein [Corynebacterium sp.]|uniref:RloB family protein n=1 Tax=Corynebacterium sp. TaxID=1720 RepID=UPI0026DDC4D7|nr:RloB family protein [Corynebacterium sp.]MDO5098701.1 RloB family protein [Corynebacterium sp.]
MARKRDLRQLDFTKHPVGTRQPRKLFLIVTEGQTEEKYFRHLQKALSLLKSSVRVEFEVVSSKNGTDPASVLSEMMKLLDEKKKDDRLRSGDFAWIVVDEDEGIQEQFDKVQEWLAERPDRFLGYSKPQFEYWLCLHFDKITGVATQKKCMEKLKSFVPTYKKNDDKLLSSFSENVILAAVTHAHELRPKITLESTVADLRDTPAAVTTVHLLVEQLIQLRDSH